MSRLLLCFFCLLLAPPPAAAQVYMLPHTDTSVSSSFGAAVAIDGNRALVGASGEDACGENAGATYVYERNPEAPGKAWRKVARLEASDCRDGAFFGRSLSLSGDRALIGATTEFFADEASNVAYIFERDPSGDWHETSQLTVEPGRAEGTFAASVALDGDRALITTQGDPASRHQGRSGAAYIFERNPTSDDWDMAARLSAHPDAGGVFGGAGALHSSVAVVTSAPSLQGDPGFIYVYERDPGGNWRAAARFREIEDFFISVDLHENRIVVGESRAGRRQGGAVTVISRREDGRWERNAHLQPKIPYASGAFGTAVSLHGDRLLATGYDEQLGFEFNIDRVVYVFAYDERSHAWKQRQIIDIGEVDFGTAIDHDGHTAIIGHVPEDRPGMAYIVGLR